jgi:hypothetical protein
MPYIHQAFEQSKSRLVNQTLKEGDPAAQEIQCLLARAARCGYLDLSVTNGHTTLLFLFPVAPNAVSNNWWTESLISFSHILLSLAYQLTHTHTSQLPCLDWPF